MYDLCNLRIKCSTSFSLKRVFRPHGWSPRWKRRDSRCRSPNQGLIPELTGQMSLTVRSKQLSNYTGNSVREERECKRNEDKAWEKIRVRSVAVTNPSFPRRRLCLLWPSYLRALNITSTSPRLCAASLDLACSGSSLGCQGLHP